MTVLLWCVVAACALPYLAHLLVGVARLQRGEFDNHKPRLAVEELQGWGRRAWWAEQNLFEGLPVFVAVALVAHVVGADPQWAGGLGIGWVCARTVYVGAYLADIAWVRTGLFVVSSLCSVGLVVVAAITA